MQVTLRPCGPSKRCGPAVLLSHGSGAAGFTSAIDVSAPAGLSAVERWWLN